MYIIVGVDPGTTFAVAAVDLKGRIVGTWSGRDAGKGETLAQMRKFGVPCLFASDVSKAPEALLKLSAYSNTRLFTPPRDLGQREKSELAAGFKCTNEHELDALAAARKAYHHFENKLRLIDRSLAEKGLEDKAEDVKRLAIGGFSVYHSLLLFEEKEKEKIKEGRAAALPTALKSESKSRRNIIEELISLANANNELQKAVERLERENAGLRERTAQLERGISDRLARDREIRYRDRLIHNLKSLLSQRYQRKPARKALKAFPTKEKKVDLEGIIDEYRQT